MVLILRAARKRKPEKRKPSVRDVVNATVHGRSQPKRINLFHELSLPVGYHSRSLNVRK